MNNAEQNNILSKEQCTALRALAIMAIMLHNYCHWLNPIVKENEYQFIHSNVEWFCDIMAHPDALLPMHLLSFFGHYGVPVFLFLSAYGLELKYGKAQNRPAPPVFRFVRYHYLKLFKMMIVGFVAFIIVDRLTPGSFAYTVNRVMAQLFMYGNLLPKPDDEIWPGPFWFFGLMLQLYAIYRLFIFRRPTLWTVALIVVATLPQLFMDPEGDAINYYRYNSLGGILPFGLGVVAARHLRANLRTDVALALTVGMALLVIVGSLSFGLWVLVPAFVCVLSVAFARAIPSSWVKALSWLGALSPALFVIHPTLRKIFIGISRQGDLYTGLLLYVIASLGVAWMVKKVMDNLPNPKM